MKISLTRDQRLRSKVDIDRVFISGYKRTGSGFKLIYRANGLLVSRFAICPVRKFGNAVSRNHAKRVCREVLRLMKHRIVSGYDMVFVLYPDLETFADRKNHIHRVLNREHLLCDK